MDTTQKINQVGTNIQEKAAVIWNVANSLFGAYKPHEYGLVILPMVVIKRFHDCLLPTHDKVVATFKSIQNLAVKEPFLLKASGYKFYNTSEYTFEKLKAEASAVHITVDQSELYDWLTIGGVMVFNEMNMAEANFFASFTNQLLDGTGFLNIPGRGEVDIDPNCVLFGTQNADYQGVEIQNEATMSRFGCLYFKQPRTVKPQLMTAVSSALKKCGYEDCMLDEIYFDQCEAFYKQCQKAVESGLVANSVLNIRGFVRALTAVAKSNGCAKLRRQVEIHVINTCPVDDRAQLNIAADSLITM